MMLELFITSLLVLNPNHELNRNPELRADVAGHFEAAGKKYDVEPTLLVYWAYRESSLKITAKGKLGEVGYCQAHGKARKTCEVAGHNPTTREGGAMCLGLIMSMGRRRCGTLERGAVWYASGRCRGTPRTQKLIKWRLQEWRRRWRAIK